MNNSIMFKRYTTIAIGEDEYLENIRVDTNIPTGEILTISPMLNKYGAKLKKVSLISDRYGNQYKVDGNYKDIIDKVRNNTKQKIGFK